MSQSPNVRIERAGEMRDVAPHALERRRPPWLSEDRCFDSQRDAVGPPAESGRACPQGEINTQNRSLGTPHDQARLRSVEVLFGEEVDEMRSSGFAETMARWFVRAVANGQ